MTGPAGAEYCIGCGKSIADHSDDVVGAGRYVLNFFIAPVIGLGITIALRRHGWLPTWISLAVVTVTVIALIVVAAIVALLETNEVHAFTEELDAIILDYNSGYLLAVSSAALQLETDCTIIEPDPAVADCDAFMAELAAADVELEQIIVRLTSLADDIPDSAPEQVDLIMANVVRSFELEHASNEALAEGWYQQDTARWQEGWDLSFRAADESLNLAEEILRLAAELEE